MILVSAFVLTNCNNEEDPIQPEEKPFINPDVAKTYKGTQSPGDVWSWTLDEEQGHMTATWDYGTFDDTSDDIYIEGTYESLPSGFMKVTIVKSVPVHQEIPTDGSAWFYAIEVPDMAMIIKPEGSIKGDVIAMVPEGDCSAIPGTYNYIITAPGERSAYDPITDEAFGYLEVKSAANGYDLSGYKFSLDCIGGNCTDTGEINGFPVATCGDYGNVRIDGGNGTVAEGQFTNAGVMMMDFGFGNGGIFALKASDLATKEALHDNTYNGVAYLPKNNDDKTMPVQLNFFENELSTTIGTGYPYTNIETVTLSEQEGIVIVVENVINGRVLGKTNFDNDDTMSEMAGALLVNGSQHILVLSSYDEESKDPFILILTKTN